MRVIQTLAVVLFAAAGASCKTPQAVKSATSPIPEVVVQKEYITGKTIIQEYPKPDSAFVAPAPELTTQFIQTDDITGEQAMATAVEWSKSFHALKGQYDTLKGWIAGVAAGQRNAQAAIDAQEAQNAPATATDPKK